MTTRVRTADPLLLMKAALTACALAAGLLLALPSWAQSDGVLAQGRAAGAVGEQADGYLGFPPGASVSADLRARVEQVNIGRRRVYMQRATEQNVSVNEMAAAVACEIFSSRVAAGERYRGEDGTWRTRAAGQAVVMPSFCPS